MKENIKHALAKKNDREKLFLDDEIGKAVSSTIAPNEENAQDRKMITALIQALKQANIEIPAEALTEFEQYNNQVEQIKQKTKSSFSN